MGRKRVAIVQSSYIPWKGYFDLIRAADEFLLLDDVQFTKRDWRSRNRIKTKDGLAWLSIPVNTRGLYRQQIADVIVADPSWGRRHWQTIRSSYARAPHFRRCADVFEALYMNPPSLRLSEINAAFISAICRQLDIGTPIRPSTEYGSGDDRNRRLIDLCIRAGATEYLSGPSAREYLDVEAFAAAGLAVRFADYSGYPPYPQPHPPFEHAVSALDLLFCTGPDAREHLVDVCAAPACA